MHDLVRFRIKPACLAEALSGFARAGVKPDKVIERNDGEIAVEFRNLTYEEAAALVAAFRPEHSAIMGILGGNPFETKH